MTARAPLTGPSVWLGAEMARSTRWLRDFSADHVGEIDAALAQVRRRGLAWSEIKREDFPLPTVSALLADAADELENGSGMVKLRGLPVARYDDAALRAIYFGLGLNLGTPVFQNRRGELMRAIRDEGADVGRRYGQIEGKAGEAPFLSSYARTLSNGRLRFHTDRTDAVGLFCLRQARAGGVSKISSTGAIHNAMLERRPDLLDVLFQDVWRSRLGEESDAPASVYPLPIFGLRAGKLTSHFSLTYIEAAELVPHVPKLTPAQREAIGMLLDLAEALSFEMTLEPGDLQLLNSHMTYHGRTAFEDDKSSGRDRLLLRLWLAMPNSRALPPGHEVLWGNIAAGAKRGGIGQVPA
ncbi:MAG TPA: TauD/TfdA family dioxygenase [Candidatus Cybelea sp.]|nr:TauD/TfdA family dioxygenase [Candidatus Cybelea sp.]